jgi:hypothetical protein
MVDEAEALLGRIPASELAEGDGSLALQLAYLRGWLLTVSRPPGPSPQELAAALRDTARHAAGAGDVHWQRRFGALKSLLEDVLSAGGKS